MSSPYRFSIEGEGSDFLHTMIIYIYDNQVVGIQHFFFIFKELIKKKKI